MISLLRKKIWQLRLNEEGGACFIVGGENTSAKCSGYALVADNKWHHIAGVFENGLISLYVDGIIEEIIEVDKTGITDSPIVIGGEITKEKQSGFIKGYIDEIELYDEALDCARVRELGNYDKAVGFKFIRRYNEFAVYPIQAHRGGGIALPENTLETFD